MTHQDTTHAGLAWVVLCPYPEIRRARIALDMIERYYPEATMSQVGAADLAIPEV